MSNIVPFPFRNKGRVRKSTSANSEGLLAIHQLGASGENIEVFNLHRQSDVMESIDIYLLEKVLNALPSETRDRVKASARCDAALGDSDRRRIAGAIVAHSLLV